MISFPEVEYLLTTGKRHVPPADGSRRSNPCFRAESQPFGPQSPSKLSQARPYTAYDGMNIVCFPGFASAKSFSHQFYRSEATIRSELSQRHRVRRPFWQWLEYCKFAVSCLPGPCRTGDAFVRDPGCAASLAMTAGRQVRSRQRGNGVGSSSIGGHN